MSGLMRVMAAAIAGWAAMLLMVLGGAYLAGLVLSDDARHSAVVAACWVGIGAAAVQAFFLVVFDE